MSKVPMMSFSEAIRLGAMLRPQAFFALFSRDGTCALGAALEAVGMRRFSIMMIPRIMRAWGWAFETSSLCPAEEAFPGGCFGSRCKRYTTWEMVTHLNDDHRWSREKIADWVQAMEQTRELSALRAGEKSEALVTRG